MNKRKIAFAQGLYYTASGVWPLVNMRSFEAVTGPKRERWLVKTVGVLVTVMGGVMTAAAARRNVDITYIVMDNEIYGLTKGQASPTSPVGMERKASPYGTIEQPLNPPRLLTRDTEIYGPHSVDASSPLLSGLHGSNAGDE